MGLGTPGVASQRPPAELVAAQNADLTNACGGLRTGEGDAGGSTCLGFEWGPGVKLGPMPIVM